MKLLTHNMLTSHVKGVKNGYPLKILARSVEVKEVEFNAEFIARMMQRLEWRVVKEAADTVGHGEGLPAEPPQTLEENEDFLKKAHHVLLEIEVVEGDLECPESGHKFPITGGIPNLLLTEEQEQSPKKQGTSHE